MNSAESQTPVLTPRQKALDALYTPNPVFLHNDSPDYGSILEEFHKASVELDREGIGSESRKRIESEKRLMAAAEELAEGAVGYLPGSLKEPISKRPIYVMPPERGMDAVDWATICVLWAIVSALFVALVAAHYITNAAGFAWINLSTALTFLALHRFRARDLKYVDSLHREILTLHERISAECGKGTSREDTAAPQPAATVDEAWREILGRLERISDRRKPLPDPFILNESELAKVYQRRPHQREEDCAGIMDLARVNFWSAYLADRFINQLHTRNGFREVLPRISRETAAEFREDLHNLICCVICTMLQETARRTPAQGR